MALQKKTVIVILLVIAALLAAVKFLMKPLAGNKAPEMMETVEEDADTEMMEPPYGETVPKENGAMMMDKDAGGMGMMSDQGMHVVTDATSYSNPGGSDEVSFTVTVDGAGVITKAETGVLAKNPTSKMRQESFAAALPAAIVGKKLSELSNIDRVGGSSLTTNAFNASLAKLKSQI